MPMGLFSTSLDKPGDSGYLSLQGHFCALSFFSGTVAPNETQKSKSVNIPTMNGDDLCNQKVTLFKNIKIFDVAKL